jgi:type I site-specific restriction endonuclease
MLRLREQSGKQQVYDGIRRRYVFLSPEEWVRQHFIHYLVSEKKVPASLVAVEMPLKYNRMMKRSDIVVFGRNGTPLLMVECKAPEVPVTQDVFHQVAMYNVTLKVPYLVVTNGLEHFACRINFGEGTYHFLKEIPGYGEMAGDTS